ncbi:MAG: N-acetyl-D-Glu racemase DgcA [Alphaproteobacteria bacterium]
MIRLAARAESWPLAKAFSISRGRRTETELVVCEVSDGTHTGRGECMANIRYGETQAGVVAELEALAPALAGGLDRLALQHRMPAGAARNALDCALWDLEAKQAGRPVWALAGLPRPEPLQTVYTLSVDTPERMAEAAAAEAARPVLKMKLTGDGDLERVAAVRQAAPDARLVVDANEAWTPEMVGRFATALKALGVQMIEQPLPADADAALAGYPHPLPFCADESCHTATDVERLRDRYEMLNIKLDKTGGLTEALRLRAAALAAGMQVMVGCMVATSLSMAPAFLVAQGAAVVDLDGPLLLGRDRPHGLRYDGSTVHPPEAALWG